MFVVSYFISQRTLATGINDWAAQSDAADLYLPTDSDPAHHSKI
jgi:hypothetical protein